MVGGWKGGSPCRMLIIRNGRGVDEGGGVPMSHVDYKKW